MATLVASASAVSSHASAQPEENNVYNDSLSFSNNQVIEKRRVSQDLKGNSATSLSTVVSSPPQSFPVLGNDCKVGEWVSDEQLVVEFDGSFCRFQFETRYSSSIILLFCSRWNVYCSKHKQRSRVWCNNGFPFVCSKTFSSWGEAEAQVEVLFPQPSAKMGSHQKVSIQTVYSNYQDYLCYCAGNCHKLLTVGFFNHFPFVYIAVVFVCIIPR